LSSLGAGFETDAMVARKRQSETFDASAETREMVALRARPVSPGIEETARRDSVVRVMAEAPVLTDGFGVDYLEGMARPIARDPALSFDGLAAWVDHRIIATLRACSAMWRCFWRLYVHVQDHAPSQADGVPDTYHGVFPRHAAFTAKLAQANDDAASVQAGTVFFGRELVDHGITGQPLFEYPILA